MTPEQKLQALLRLKKHEQPPADYFENFLAEFHQRQRESLMKQSVLSLFWERLTTWVSCLQRPVVMWSTAGAYAAVILLICLWPKPPAVSNVSPILVTMTPASLPEQVQPSQASPAPPRPRNSTNVITVSNQPEEELPPGTGVKQKDAVVLPPLGKPQPPPPAATAPDPHAPLHTREF
jgi:hypothetical protein